MSVVRGMGRWAAVGVVLGVLSGSAVGQDTQQPIDGRPAVSETVTADTAAAVFERLERRLQIERDGRATQTTAARIRIRDSSALASLGHLYFSYVPVLETIELVVVKVDKANGQQITVDAAALKDVPTPESGSFEGPTFTDARVKQVAVPALSVGDALSYEYVLRRHTPLAQGHFWTEYTFTRAAIVLEESFELDWPADLSLSVHAAVGPVEQAGLIARTGRILRRWTHSQQQLTAKDQAALRKLSVAAGNGKAPLPDIQVSTFETWDQVASWYGALTADAETPSPAVRDKARSLMQSAATPQAQLAALHKFVAQDVRYVSLAFGDGRYRPRRAELVMTTQYGDCKDKHSLLASLAREAGFTVEPLLINTMRPLDRTLPSPGQFNHVITRVTGKGMEPTWIDGTVAVTRPGTLLLPLRGKTGLLASAAPELIATPAAHADPQRVRVTITGSYQADGRYRATVRREFRGDFEAAMRASMAGADHQARRQAAEAHAKDEGYGNDAKIVRVAAGEPNDLDAPFWWEYEVEAKYTSPHRAAAYTFWIPTPELELPAPDDDELEAVDLGPAATVELTARFELPTTLVITPPVTVSIDNDLANYVSRYIVDKGVLQIERTLTTKVETAPPAAIGAYKALRRAADSDHRQKFAVSAASAEVLREIAAGRDLAAAGYQALEDGDVVRSVELLTKAVAAQPSHRSAWNTLGRALHRQGEWDKAIEAYSRQAAIDPFHQYAYNNRGLSEWRLGKHAEAEASFRKQIEVTPLDKRAHKNLGGLFLELDRGADARDAYLKAASITPDDAWVQIGVARALIAIGQRDDAVAHFERAVEISATPAIWNDVAWRMVEAEVALDKALDYARSAVAAATAATAAASVDKPLNPQIAMGSSLASYWDTLGWVYYKRGALQDALRFLKVSWQVRQDPEVGDHLGRAYEQLGRRGDALVVYRLALALRSGSDTLRARLRGRVEALGGAGALVVHDPRRSGPNPSDPRSVKIGQVGPARATAEVMLVIASDGRVMAARAVGTGGPGSVAIARLEGVRLPLDAPDPTPFKIVVRAAVSCSEAPVTCTLTVFRLEDALRLKVD